MPVAQAAELVFPSVANLEPGDLIKSPDASTVYYFGQDEMRYGFPNEGTYFSWYEDFSAVKTISSSQLAAIPLGDMVTFLCDEVLIKTVTSSTVYVVLPFEHLLPLMNETEAVEALGEDWVSHIIVVPQEYLGLYTVLDPQDTEGLFDYMFGTLITELLKISLTLMGDVMDENGNIDTDKFDDASWYTIDMQERTDPVTGIMIYDDPHRFAFSDETEDCGIPQCYYDEGTIESGSTIKFVNYTNDTLTIRESENQWTTGPMNPGDIVVLEVNLEPGRYIFEADQDKTLFGDLIVE